MRTIFSRLVTIFIVILIVSFSITGAVLYYYLTDFTLREKTDFLQKSSDVVGDSFVRFIDNINDTSRYADKTMRNAIIGFTILSFEQQLQAYASYTSSYIWVVDSEGRILFTKPELPISVQSKLRKDNTDSFVLSDKRQYEKVMSGQKVKEIGDFYGFFKDKAFKSDSWLTIETPVKVNYTVGDISHSVAAIYMHTSVPEVQSTRTAVFRIFLQSVAVAVIISIVLVYIFSRKLTSPLKQMNEAVKIITGGEFSKRVNVNSKDEVGELASSFNQMLLALQQLEDMRRGFIANVSHELRTPMTSIRGFIEGILDGTIPPEKHNYYLEIVRDETNRLNRLVNDLLDLAKMEAGEITLKMRKFNINELIRVCVIKLERMIVEKGLEVQADFEQEDVFVSADKDAIERVIYNLLHNAIKFTSEKGKVIIGTAISKGKVLVWVQDTGLGIEKDEIDLIWDRFYKSDKSRSSDKSGTGLGLAIIKNIINEHRQKIWVESEPGKGAKFLFTLEKADHADNEQS